jgi:hypothetical protein
MIVVHRTIKNVADATGVYRLQNISQIIDTGFDGKQYDVIAECRSPEMAEYIRDLIAENTNDMRIALMFGRVS